jgi:hypothetical protein
VPFQLTAEVFEKPVPFTRRVNGPAPALIAAGTRGWAMDGTATLCAVTTPAKAGKNNNIVDAAKRARILAVMFVPFQMAATEFIPIFSYLF